MSLPVDETMLGSLRSSNIGKYVKLLTLHSKEKPDNKRTAQACDISSCSRAPFTLYRPHYTPHYPHHTLTMSPSWLNAASKM